MTTLPPDMPPESPPPERVMLPTLETPTLTKAELAELLFERDQLPERARSREVRREHVGLVGHDP